MMPCGTESFMRTPFSLPVAILCLCVFGFLYMYAVLTMHSRSKFIISIFCLVMVVIGTHSLAIGLAIHFNCPDTIKGSTPS